MHVFASKIVITFVAVLVAVGLSAEPVAQPAEPVFAIVPLPAKLTPGCGVFTLRATTPIVTDAVLRSRGRQLASLPAPATGFDLGCGSARRRRCRTSRCGSSDRSPKYLGRKATGWTFTPRAITIRAASPTGVS